MVKYFRRIGDVLVVRGATYDEEQLWFESITMAKEINIELQKLIMTEFTKLDKFPPTDELSWEYVIDDDTVREYFEKLIEIGNHASNILRELEGDVPYED